MTAQQRYKFISDHTVNYRVWDPSIGTGSSINSSYTFKKDQIVNGSYKPESTTSGEFGIIGPMTIPEGILVPNPMAGKGPFNGNGAPTAFLIPIDKVNRLPLNNRDVSRVSILILILIILFIYYKL